MLERASIKMADPGARSVCVCMFSELVVMLFEFMVEQESFRILSPFMR